MKLSESELTLINKGSNSDIYRYGSERKGVILKMVDTTFKKECKHLLNEFQTLSCIKHDNIIKALKYKQNVHLHGTGSSYN